MSIHNWFASAGAQYNAVRRYTIPVASFEFATAGSGWICCRQCQLDAAADIPSSCSSPIAVTAAGDDIASLLATHCARRTTRTTVLVRPTCSAWTCTHRAPVVARPLPVQASVTAASALPAVAACPYNTP